MSVLQSAPAPLDASAIAAEVRQLAHQTHCLINDPTADSSQFDELARRIARFRRQVAARRGTPVARWLDRLELMLSAELIQR